MYHEVEANTFTALAEELIQHQQVSVRIHSSSPDWGHSVAKRVQGIFLETSKRNGSSPMSASFDECEVIKGEPYNIYKFSLEEIKNKSLIHHAMLTRFKEEEK